MQVPWKKIFRTASRAADQQLLKGQVLKGQLLKGQVLKGQVLKGQLLKGSVVAVALCLWPMSGSLTGQTHAQAIQPVRFKPTNPPPPTQTTPRTPFGTGSRGGCFTARDRLPLTQLTGSAGLDLTVSEYPTFWVYVPYAYDEVPTGEFSLQADDNEIFHAEVVLPVEPGIIGIMMPKTVSPLEVGTRYRWYFDVPCQQTEASEEATIETVTGVVKRILPSRALVDDLNHAQTPLETISAYATNHIWYDTFTEFTSLRLKNPGNPTLGAMWAALLSDPNVGLQDWANAPIRGEVNSEVGAL